MTGHFHITSADTAQIQEEKNGKPYRILLLRSCFILLGINLAASLLGALLDPQSKIRLVRRALSFKQRDSWYPMLEAIGWSNANRGSDVYTHTFFEEHTKFQYPLTALPFVGWVDSSSPHAITALNVANFVLLVAAAVGAGLLLQKLVQSRLGASAEAWLHAGRAAFVLGAVATLCFYPITFAFSLGQIQLFQDTVFIFACLSILGQRKLNAGILMGVSSLIKPQMGLFLLWAAIRREWWTVIGFTLAVLVGAGVTISLYGLDWIASYWKVLSFISAHGEAFYANHSANGLANRWLNNGSNLEWNQYEYAPYAASVWATTTVASVFFAAFGVLWALHRREEKLVDSFAAAGICFTIASPIAWDHHFGVLLPALALWFVVLVERNAFAAWMTDPEVWLFGITDAVASNDFTPVTNLLADTWLNPLQAYLLFASMLALWGLRSRSPTSRSAWISTMLTRLRALPKAASTGPRRGTGAPDAVQSGP